MSSTSEHASALQLDDEAWVEVLRKTEEAYARSVQYQVELERKNEELEQAHQFIHAVIDAMSDVLVVLDHDLNILQVNRACIELSGFSCDALLGKPVSMLFRLEEDFLQRIQHGRIEGEIQLNMHTRHGEIPLAVRCSCQNAHACPVDVGRVLVGRPIGELLEAYSSLRKAHETLQRTQETMIQTEKMAALGRLVAGVAHELSNPISFVYANFKTLRFYLDQLYQHYPPETDDAAMIWTDMPSLLSGTEEGIVRISNLVNQLKQFSRIQNERTEPLKLKKQVEDAIRLVSKSSAEGERLKVKLSLPEALRVQANLGKLQQILVNLIQNALDAMAQQAQRQLIFSVEKRADKCCLQIRDSGPGIPPNLLDKVFDPFFTTKAVGQGTGLGLAISRALAEEMGGNLTAWNHAEGGAVFQLCLPEAPV